MNSIKATLAILVSAIMVAGCGEKVPTDIVDNNQIISQRNSQKNLNAYLSTMYPSGTVDVNYGELINGVTDSDSTISASCRYGDGWATGTVRFKTGKVLTMKCQTNGAGKGMFGCLTNAEFQKKEYKNEDGVCQSSITELKKM
jgi:hypothetical protein